MRLTRLPWNCGDSGSSNSSIIISGEGDDEINDESSGVRMVLVVVVVRAYQKPNQRLAMSHQYHD